MEFNRQKIGDPNELAGPRLQEYRLWRRDEDHLPPATEKTQMDTLRAIKYQE